MKKDDTGTLWMHSGDEGIVDEDGYLSGKCFSPHKSSHIYNA